MANKGTIFLDEIPEMSTHLQAKLLHVLGMLSVSDILRVVASDEKARAGLLESFIFRQWLRPRGRFLSVAQPFDGRRESILFKGRGHRNSSIFFYPKVRLSRSRYDTGESIRRCRTGLGDIAINCCPSDIKFFSI